MNADMPPKLRTETVRVASNEEFDATMHKALKEDKDLLDRLAKV